MKKIYFVTALILILAITACVPSKLNLFSDVPDPLKEYTLEGTGKDKILLIAVNGLISDSAKSGLITSSPSLVEQIVTQIRKAQNDKQIKAVLFKINSPGGTITASDLLYHEILLYKEKTGAKIVVSMMDLATSGAYYMSLPAD